MIAESHLDRNDPSIKVLVRLPTPDRRAIPHAQKNHKERSTHHLHTKICEKPLRPVIFTPPRNSQKDNHPSRPTSHLLHRAHSTRLASPTQNPSSHSPASKPWPHPTTTTARYAPPNTGTRHPNKLTTPAPQIRPLVRSRPNRRRGVPPAKPQRNAPIHRRPNRNGLDANR